MACLCGRNHQSQQDQTRIPTIDRLYIYCDKQVHHYERVVLWQFWVETKHYSVAYFDCVTTFDALQHRTFRVGFTFTM